MTGDEKQAILTANPGSLNKALLNGVLRDLEYLFTKKGAQKWLRMPLPNGQTPMEVMMFDIKIVRYYLHHLIVK